MGMHAVRVISSPSSLFPFLEKVILMPTQTRPNGVCFLATAGTTEFVNRWNPQPDDIVSFKHHGFLLATKKPKFPTLYRVRRDLEWDQVVQNAKQVKPLPAGKNFNTTSLSLSFSLFFFSPFLFLSLCLLSLPSLAPHSHTPIVSLPHKGYKQGKRPVGYWKAVAKRRQFFCDFAKRQGFDPLKADEWKNVTKSQIIEARVFNLPYKVIITTFSPILGKGYFEDV